MKFNIPDKLYFKIGEVSKLARVPTHVLRYWETEFKDITPRRASSMQRLYSREDVELILTIKMLLHERRYTIAGARQLIESGQNYSDDLAVGHKRSMDLANAAEASEVLGSIKSELQELQQFIDKKR